MVPTRRFSLLRRYLWFYQRRKGRDLFDLGIALAASNVDPVRILDAFTEYMTRGGHPVTRAMFERNLNAKLRDPQFTADIQPPGISRRRCSTIPA